MRCVLIITYRSTVMNNLHLVNVHIFRVAPQESQYKIVYRWDRLVYILEEHVQKVLHIIKINFQKSLAEL